MLSGIKFIKREKNDSATKTTATTTDPTSRAMTETDDQMLSKEEMISLATKRNRDDMESNSRVSFSQMISDLSDRKTNEQPLSLSSNAADAAISNSSMASLLRARLIITSKTAATSELSSNAGLYKRLRISDGVKFPYNSTDNYAIMAKHERVDGSSSNLDDIYAKNILRLGNRYEGREARGGDKSGMDEEESDIDMTMFTRKSEPQLDVARSAFRHSQAQTDIEKNCEFCSMQQEGKRRDIDRLVCRGKWTILCLKSDHLSLAEYHCEIVPLVHVCSILASADEEVLKEIERWKSCFQRMCESRNQTALFLEAALEFKRNRHARIDAIPLPLDIANEATMFFKQALTSCDEEWSSHRKLINLTNSRPLSKAIPHHFTYLCVQWHSSDDRDAVHGFAHSVEDESKIAGGSDFCLDVVAGMLETDAMRLRRRRTDSGVKPSRLTSFKKLWDEFDWTKYTF